MTKESQTFKGFYSPEEGMEYFRKLHNLQGGKVRSNGLMKIRDHDVGYIDMLNVVNEVRKKLTYWQNGFLDMYLKYGDFPNTNFYNKNFKFIMEEFKKQLIKKKYLEDNNASTLSNI